MNFGGPQKRMDGSPDPQDPPLSLGDWSLITRRGAYKTGGGACEVLPLRKGAENVLAMLKGGGTKCFEVVLTRELEVLAIVMGGGHKRCPPFKGGAQNVLPCLKGGRAQQVLDSQFSHFVAPPPPPPPPPHN